MAEERRCARGVRCLRSERQGAVQVGARLTTPVGLCAGCRNYTAVVVGALVNDLAELTTIVGSKPDHSLGVGYISKTINQGVPVRLAVDALRRMIDVELCHWAVSCGLDPDRLSGCRQGARCQRAAAFLATRVDDLLRLPARDRRAWSDFGEPLADPVSMTGLEGACWLHELHRRTRVVLGRTRLVHRLSAPCPWCDSTSLIRHDGSSNVDCEACGKQVEERFYSWMAKVIYEHGKLPL